MPEQPPTKTEPFVPSDVIAGFLALSTRRVKELARIGQLPAYPLGNGQRRIWRFRLSEVAATLCQQTSRRAVEFSVTQTRSTKG